jgi:hypothetical protein
MDPQTVPYQLQRIPSIRSGESAILTAEQCSTVQNHLEHEDIWSESLKAVPVVANGDALTFAEFCVEYMSKNIPVLVKNASTSWLSPFDHMDLLGDSVVPVAQSGESYQHQERSEMTFAEFTEMLKERDSLSVGSKEEKDLPDINGIESEIMLDDRIGGPFLESCQEHSREATIYLKDWHIFRDLAEKTKSSSSTQPALLTLPTYLTSDWLNLYYLYGRSEATVSDDYRFCYCGPSWSRTTFHTDVMKSYSWSANVKGAKLWRLIPPRHSQSLVDEQGNFPSALPTFVLPHTLTLLQKSGELLFVPSGWAHSVLNLDISLSPTISYNANWFNACNISHVSVAILRDSQASYHSIESMIADRVELLEQTELITRCLAGWSLSDFLTFLQWITHRLQLDLQAVMHAHSPSSPREKEEGEEKGHEHWILLQLHVLSRLQHSLAGDAYFSNTFLHSSQGLPSLQQLWEQWTMSLHSHQQ